MHFEILGRLRVTDDHGRDVVLAGRQAALLGILLMRANEVVASDRLIDEELALGHHTRVVAELQSLVASHRLSERLRAQLMLALYRCGRQADALEVYRDGRRQLVDELGIEPGMELRELERAILAHDPE